MGAEAAILLSGGAIIDVDGSLFVQLILFFSAFFILKALVFRPAMALFDARTAAVDGVRAAAKAEMAAAEEKVAALNAQLERVRQDANAEREALRRQGLAAEREVLQATLGELEDGTARHLEALQQERAALEAEVQSLSRALAEQMASKLLGRQVHS
ncbi:MAG: hypothetical protein ACPGUV_04640 [Polyangiales bacterium]